MIESRDVEVFDQLIEQGRAFGISETRAKRTYGGPVYRLTKTGTYRTVDATLFDPWRVDALFAVEQTFGRDSTMWTELHALHSHSLGTVDATTLQTAIGLLERGRDAIKNGRLLKATDRAVAGAFDDLLDAAQHVHEEGLHLAAVAIAGAALEAELRNLYERKIGPWPSGDHTSISRLADPLYAEHRKGDLPEFDRTEKKHVDAWGGLRNDADHGNVSNSDALQIVDSKGDPKPNIDAAKVRDMISGVRSFILKFRGVR